jgi:hypothetical protein
MLLHKCFVFLLPTSRGPGVLQLHPFPCLYAYVQSVTRFVTSIAVRKIGCFVTVSLRIGGAHYKILGGPPSQGFFPPTIGRAATAHARPSAVLGVGTGGGHPLP